MNPAKPAKAEGAKPRKGANKALIDWATACQKAFDELKL